VPTANLQPAEPSLQRELLDRLCFILAVIASMASLFVLDALFTADRLGVFFAFRCAGVAFPLTAFFVLRQRWTDAWAWPLTIGIVDVAYLLVAAAGMASPTGEYITTAEGLIVDPQLAARYLHPRVALGA
jgi:hypothetical protein